MESTAAEVAVAEMQHPAAVAMVPEVMAVLVLVLLMLMLVVAVAALEIVVAVLFCCM